MVATIGKFPDQKPQIAVGDPQEAGARWNFVVHITHNEETLDYSVVLDKEYWKRITGEKGDPKDLVEKSFEFLLERESKESILRKFDLWEINEYFPEYEEELKRVFA